MRRHLRGRPPGIQARAALAAAIAAAIAFGVGGFLFRQQLYREQLAHEATAVAAALKPLATETTPLRAGVNTSLDSGWLLLTEGGELRIWSPDLDPFLLDSDGWGGDQGDPVAAPKGLDSLRSRPFSPNTMSYHSLTFGSTREGGTSLLAGRTVEVICADFAFAPGKGAEFEFEGPPGDRGTFCKIIQPWRADQAAAAVGRFILIGMLLTALVVGGIGWLVTGTALRPVKAISRRLADITDLQLNHRVPVPASKDAIAELARTVNCTLDRLHVAAERQRRFIADASHELRSPITNLGSALEVALTYPEHANWRQVVADANAETVRLQTLVDDLLTLARLERRATPPTGKVDLAALVYEHMANRQALKPNGSRFIAEPREPIMIFADRILLDRILRNLLDNADRHARTTVQADVSTNGSGEVTLTVTNDGPPIPDQERENVFLPFTRLDDARSRNAGGAGLGLAIVREIAVRHGGNARAADNRNGATFIVTFPTTDRPVDQTP